MTALTMPKKKSHERRSGQAFFVESAAVAARLAELEKQLDAGDITADEFCEIVSHISRSYQAAETPKESTNARPGSEEKIAVMRARFAAGESVFHPNDPTIGPGGQLVEVQPE